MIGAHNCLPDANGIKLPSFPRNRHRRYDTLYNKVIPVSIVVVVSQLVFCLVYV